jgi:hypothetical protein
MMVPGDVAPQTAAAGQTLWDWQQRVKAALVSLLGVSFVALAIFFPIVFRADLNVKNDHKNGRRVRRAIVYS